MDTSKAIHLELRVGDWVISKPDEGYGCLVGQVTAIEKLGMPEHDTENETDDIHVNFTLVDYSTRRISEIEEDFSEMYGEPKNYDELPLDDVIMAPDMLIYVTEQELAEYKGGLLKDYDTAEFIGDTFSTKRFDEMTVALIERLENNYDTYQKSLLSFGQRELIDMAAMIHAYSDCWSYLTEYHTFSDAELKFLMKFENPLEIVTEQWHKRNIDVGEVEFSLDFIMEPERQKSTLEAYPLFGDKPAQSAEQNKTELPQGTPQERLYAKMSAEYHAFLDDMKLKPPDAILDESYQKVFKEDLLLSVDNGDLNEAQIDALLSLDTPLDDLYWSWLDTDVSYMDMLRDCVEDYANAVISERKAEQEKATPETTPEKPQQKPAPKQPPTLLGEVREAMQEVETRKAAHTAPTKTTKKEIDSL